ncbi:hypothetical protein DL93DRAFT_56897 [Clavulina sp. PMI_390]|nr:hypothetical protein DL93DRAFT_56897 [Clavulina sp. PMI_390]
MLRSLQELEPQLKLRYREYQAGIANGTIAPPKRRRTGDDKDKRRPSAPTAERYAPEPPSAPVAMPRTPTSIEDHQTTTVSSASRSNRPTPGVTVMLSEAQEREQRERQAQLDRDRRRDYLSDEGRRAQAYAPAPIPESAIPTPVPTPDRRDMSTLSVSQYGPSTSTYHDRPPPRDESRQAPERSDAEMRAAMLDLQADYDAKLRACMEDPSPIDEEERMRRALDIVGRTGTAERQWIEEKSQQALRRGRQSTFTQELSDQGLIHDRRIKDVKAIFARRSEEIVRRERAERDAKALAESREREARYRAEAEARERALERELAQEREREREQQIRSDREHSEHERTRAREDQLLQQRRLEATQDAMSRVSLAQQRQQAETDDYANRQRRAQDVVQARIHQGQAERADRLQREAATAAWQEREREREVVAPRATYVTSPIPPAVTYSRQPSPSPAVLVRPQSSRVEQPTSYTPTPVLSPPPVSAPSMSRPSQPPVSPAPPVPMTAPLRRPQHSRADVQPTPNPPQPPQTAAAPSYSYIPRSRSPASYDSPPQHNSDRDLLDRSVPMLHNRASNIHMAGPPRSSSHPFSSHEKVTHYPPEKLTAIAALPIESPSHSFRGSLSDEQRETVRSL